MADQLIVKLGADTSEFRGQIAGAAKEVKGLNGVFGEAGQALEHFNENTNRLQHRLLEGFIGYEAIRRVMEWGMESVKAAQKTREEFEKLGKPIDDDTRSLAEFGDALKETKEGIVSTVGSILSVFTKAGEGWGFLINRLRGYSNEEQLINEKTAKSAKEAEDARNKSIESISARIKKAQEEQAAGEKKHFDLVSTNQQKIDALKEEEIALNNTINSTGEGSVNHEEAKAKLIANQNAQLEIQKKLTDELNAKVEKALHEFFDPIDKIEKERPKVVAKTTEKYIELTAEMQKAQDAVEAMNLAQGKQNLLLEDTIILMGKAYGASEDQSAISGASSDTLKDLIEKKKKEIEKIKSETGRGDTALADAATGFLPQGIVIDRLLTDIQRAQFQLDQRQKISRDLKFGGEQFARSNFTGNPLDFDRILSQLSQTQDKSTTLLQSLDDRLSAAGFGKGG